MGQRQPRFLWESGSKPSHGIAAVMLVLGVATACGSDDSAAGTFGRLSPEDDDNPPAALELTEISAHRLPDLFIPSGISALGLDRLLIWSASHDSILFLHNGRESYLGRGLLRNPIAAAFVDDSTMEVADAGRSSIVRLSIDGHLKSELALDLPFVFESAARSNRGWFLGGRGVNRDYEVFAIEPTGKARKVYSRRTDPAAGEAVVAQLSAAGDDVLVTLLQSPFEISQLTAEGIVRRTVRPFPEGVAASLTEIQDTASSWISLPAIWLDHGIIQTLSDLASDRRMLVLYGSDERSVRHKIIEIPLGFVASVPGRELLIGARTVGPIEVVIYRWRWDSSVVP